MSNFKINGQTPQSLQDWAVLFNVQDIYLMWRPGREVRDLQCPILTAWSTLWQTSSPKQHGAPQVRLRLGGHIRELHDGEVWARDRFKFALLAHAACLSDKESITPLSARRLLDKPDLEINADAGGCKHLVAIMECEMAEFEGQHVLRTSPVPATMSAIRAQYRHGIAKLMLHGGQAWSGCGNMLAGLFVNNCFWRMLIVPSGSVDMCQDTRARRVGSEAPTFVIEVADESDLTGKWFAPTDLLGIALEGAALPPNKFPEYRWGGPEPLAVTSYSALGRLQPFMIVGGLLAETIVRGGERGCCRGLGHGDPQMPIFDAVLASVIPGSNRRDALTTEQEQGGTDGPGTTHDPRPDEAVASSRHHRAKDEAHIGTLASPVGMFRENEPAPSPLPLTMENLARLERSLAFQAVGFADAVSEASSKDTATTTASERLRKTQVALSVLDELGCRILFATTASMDEVFEGLGRDLAMFAVS